MDCVIVSGVPSKNRRLMMSLAGTPRASASSCTVMPSDTRTVSISSGDRPCSSASWSLASCSARAASRSRFSLRFLRRPVDSREASSTAARASCSTFSRLYSSASRAMRA